METRAAVLFGPGQDWKVEQITLDPPGAGEVLVEVRAAGVCHSDEHMREMPGVLPAVREMMGTALYPLVGGHEGAGVVLEVGAGVTHLRAGDHVAMSFIPTCGSCHYCVTGRGNLCDNGAQLMLKGQITDGTARHHLDGADLNTLSKLGTWSERTVVAAASLIRIDEAVPFGPAALTSCGVSTGFGSAVDRGAVKAGETVVVVGAGGVGTNAVQGARIAGALHIIAVDPVELKREMAPRFGATAVVSSTDEAESLLGRLTRGRMADVVIITVGEIHPEDIGRSMALAGKDGRIVLTAMGSTAEQLVPISLFELSMWNKAILGTVYGSRDPRSSVPELLALYRSGKLLLDELITRTFTLDQVNEATRAMLDGEVIRGVIHPYGT